MLIFPLKKEWYEKIKSGEKKVEYREIKPYWTSRLVSFYKENTEKNDDFHKYIVDWDKELLDHEIYFTPSEMFVNYFASKEVSFFNAWCQLRLGYTKEYLSARIIKIEIVDGKNTDLHIDKPMYAIHLADVRE